MNGYLKAVLLLAFLTALFMGVGAMIGGRSGMMIAFFIALGMNFFAWWNSDQMVLRLYKAQPLEPGHSFYEITKTLVDNAHMPMPKLYMIENAQPNAFATGRSPEKGAVALTTGLIDRLSTNEVAAVIAHELAHIKNRDTLIMTITATLAGALSMLANFAMFFGGNRNGNNGMGIIGVLVVVILAPLAATLVQMAISRSREFEADRIGAEICGRPLWLADALTKISSLAQKIDNHQAEANPATAHMFIMNPLHVHSVDGLFKTHPSTEERVKRLQAMA